MTEENKKWHREPVPWSIFIWVVGIVTIGFTTFIFQHEQIKEEIRAETSARITADITNNQVANEIKTALAGIQADLKNLDARILELRTDIKSLK